MEINEVLEPVIPINEVYDMIINSIPEIKQKGKKRITFREGPNGYITILFDGRYVVVNWFGESKHVNVEDCIDNDELLAKRILLGIASILSKKQRKMKNESRKMVVKLTESELHEMVKKVLTELNRKTYANAMRKSDRMSREYGDDSFNRAERVQKSRIDGLVNESLKGVIKHLINQSEWETTSIYKLAEMSGINISYYKGDGNVSTYISVSESGRRQDLEELEKNIPKFIKLLKKHFTGEVVNYNFNGSQLSVTVKQ